MSEKVYIDVLKSARISSDITDDCQNTVPKLIIDLGHGRLARLSAGSWLYLCQQRS
jgi:hypothetical protein